MENGKLKMKIGKLDQSEDWRWERLKRLERC